MKKSNLLYIILTILGLVLLGIASFFVWKIFFQIKPLSETVKVESKTLKLDPAKEATHISKVADTSDAYWVRGAPLVWNNVEKKQGKYNWDMTDGAISGNKDGYFPGDVYHLAMIWPYANWDQDACHKDPKYLATGHLKESNEPLKVGAPCDMKAYANFLEKVVERYDGDGVDDMPGLKTPIKYWEIMNEPEMQGGQTGGAGEDLKFFVGTSQEYLEILKNSYGAVKKADPEAKVAHAGMAGMQQNFQEFWNPIFAGGAGNYFDIANIHTINTDEQREDMFVTKFKEYLAGFGIKDKPIWVTEVQFGDLMGKPKDLASFEKLMARASVFSLIKGADKLFMIENWTQWDNPDAYKKPEVKENPSTDAQGGGKPPKEPKPKIDLSQNSTHKVYLTLVKMLNNFDKVEAIKEEVTSGQDRRSQEMGGVSAKVGQYKFTNGGKVLYVLWGQASLPVEIKGTATVTDIYGTSKEIDASGIQLSDSPIFVELK